MTVILPHRVHGHGARRVLALHGWLDDRRAYDALLPLLPEAEFTVVVPDFRGYGEARDLSGEFTIGEVATDALALADSLGWTEFAVIGHSMGGKAAQRLIALAPERISRVVAISPVPASGSGFDEGTAAFFRSATGSREVRRQILDATTGTRYHAAWLDAMAGHSWRTARPEAFAGYLTSWSDEDFHTDLAGAPTPVRIVVGAHDSDLGAAAMNATLLHWLPNAELVVLADAGHYAIDETPIALATLVYRFLSEA